jgi:hypothetical protein
MECDHHKAIATGVGMGWFNNFQMLAGLPEEFVALSNLWGAKKFLKLLLKTCKLLLG